MMMLSIETRPSAAATISLTRPSAVVVERHRPAVMNLLTAEGFEIFVAPDGRVALELALMRHPTLLILDVDLPGLDGPEVCRRVRAQGLADAPAILILSDQADESVKVRAFEAGADDYVTTPFGARELVARIRSAVRRHLRPARPAGAAGLSHGELWMDPARHDVTYRGRQLDFTPTEFDIVKLLLSDPGRTFARGQIGMAIRDGFAQAADRTIDCHIKGIRRKLGDGAAVIQTVRGVGYRLRAVAGAPQR